MQLETRGAAGAAALKDFAAVGQPGVHDLHDDLKLWEPAATILNGCQACQTNNCICQSIQDLCQINYHSMSVSLPCTTQIDCTWQHPQQRRYLDTVPSPVPACMQVVNLQSTADHELVTDGSMLAHRRHLYRCHE